MKKRIFALFMAFVMGMSVIPLSVFAEGAFYSPGAVVEATEEEESGSSHSSITAGTVVSGEEAEKLESSAGTVLASSTETEGELFNSDNEAEIQSGGTESSKIPEGYRLATPEEVEILKALEVEGSYIPLESNNSSPMARASVTGYLVTGAPVFLQADAQNIFTKTTGKYMTGNICKCISSGGTYTAAYCLDEGKGIASGPYYVGDTELDPTTISIIGDILALGYQYKGSGIMPASDGYKWAVTQWFIWAAVAGNIVRVDGVNEFLHDDAGNNWWYQDAHNMAEIIRSGSYTLFIDYYNKLKEDLERLRKVPSFAYRLDSETNLPMKPENYTPVTVSLNEEGTAYTTNIKDENRVLDRYDLHVTDDYTSLSKNQHVLSVKLDAAAGDGYTVTSDVAKKTFSGGEDCMLAYIPANWSSNVQNFAAYTPDEQSIQIAFDISTTGEPVAAINYGDVTVTKSDAETGSRQGDASLSGAQYGVYKDGSLVSSYTTNSSGQFVADGLETEVNYTMREMYASPGYLLDSRSYSIYLPAPAEDGSVPSQSINVTEQVKKGRIGITKHTDEGETGIETPEESAVFQVYLSSAGSYESAKASERDELTINADGYAETKDLPWGIYTIHQVSGWEGKELVEDFQIQVYTDNKTYHVILNNRIYEAQITIIKKDIETGRVIPASGISFKIKNADTGEYIVQEISYPTPQSISTYYTDVTGKLVLPAPLEYGNYELYEISSAYGYIINDAAVSFSVDGTAKEIELVFYNAPQKGYINVYKQGEVFASVDYNGKTYTPVYELRPLEGAVFNVFAAEDITTPDGTIRAAMGELVATITTDETGYAMTDELYLGEYRVVETSAPEGYVRDIDSHYVTLSYSNQSETHNIETITVTNERQKAEIDLEKDLEKDENFGIGMNDEWQNVKFGLYAADELTAADGKTIPAAALLSITGISEVGHGEFAADLPAAGTYYVKEIETDWHYLLKEDIYYLDFEYTPGTAQTIHLHTNDDDRITNILKRADIYGTKVDEDMIFLPGALMGLFFHKETIFNEESAIMTSTSDDSGAFAFYSVPLGDYIVREIAPPTGFVLSQESYRVTLEEEGEDIGVTVTNAFIKGNVRLQKFDADYSGEALSGAVFDVYADSNANAQYDAGDVKMGTLTESEDEKGVYTMNNIRYGGYFIVESAAPEYYVTDPTPHYINIDEDGELIELEIGNEAQTGNIRIKKTSEDALVEGIKFTVSGKPYTGRTYSEEFTTDANGEIFIEGLRLGEYTVSEVIDESTVKYVVEADKAVTVTHGGEAEVKFYNKLRRGSVYVLKTDPDYPDSYLEGAEFKVYVDTDYDGNYDPETDIFHIDLQENEGIYWGDELGSGAYLLKETAAPEGYVLDENYYSFEITDDTTQVEITNTVDESAGFVNKKLSGSLLIRKVCATTSKALEGANFCVKNNNGEVVAEGTTNADGELLFEDLPYGDYVYQEIYAPEGYALDKTEHSFSIDGETQKIEVKVTNTLLSERVPQTGDSRQNPVLAVITLIVCVAAAGVLIGSLIRRKRKSK